MDEFVESSVTRNLFANKLDFGFVVSVATFTLLKRTRRLRELSSMNFILVPGEYGGDSINICTILLRSWSASFHSAGLLGRF